jgi:hypothetical protein
MDVPSELLAAFPPSAMRLFDRTRRAVDDDMLSEIASADYGSQAAEMMALLLPIRDTGIVSAASAPRLAEIC